MEGKETVLDETTRLLSDVNSPEDPRLPSRPPPYNPEASPEELTIAIVEPAGPEQYPLVPYPPTSEQPPAYGSSKFVWSTAE